MNKYRSWLTTELTVAVFIVLIVIGLYETNILLEGALCNGNKEQEFIVTTILQILTICNIPLALRLFKFEAVKKVYMPYQVNQNLVVKKVISEKREKGHFHMASLRMSLLTVPMIANIVCYYIYMNVAFLYLTIILAISLVFIIPTKDRCDSEL